VSYTYDCSSSSGSPAPGSPVGGSPAPGSPSGGSVFVADLISDSSGGSQGPDDEPIANDSDDSGSGTVTVNAQDVPGSYDIKVTSACPWTIVVQYADGSSPS
jgi:hypothetical protein